MAVANAATATPARISDVVVLPPTDRPRMYVTPTAAKPPIKAKGASSALSLDPAKASVAPSPAPAATPSKYGSARGLRNTP